MQIDTLSFYSVSTSILIRMVLWSTFLFSGNTDTYTKYSLLYVNAKTLKSEN